MNKTEDLKLTSGQVRRNQFLRRSGERESLILRYPAVIVIKTIKISARTTSVDAGPPQALQITSTVGLSQKDVQHGLGYFFFIPNDILGREFDSDFPKIWFWIIFSFFFSSFSRVCLSSSILRFASTTSNLSSSRRSLASSWSLFSCSTIAWRLLISFWCSSWEKAKWVRGRIPACRDRESRV